MSTGSKIFIMFSVVFSYLLLFVGIFYIFLDEFETPNITFSIYQENLEKNGCSLVRIEKSNYEEFFETDSNCSFYSSYGIIENRGLREKLYSKVSNQMKDSIHGSYKKIEINYFDYQRYSIEQEDYKDAILLNNQIIIISANFHSKKDALKFAQDIDLNVGISPAKILIDLVIVIFVTLILVSWWHLNVKLGRMGYICLIPIYNVICLSEDIFHKKIMGLLFLIPTIQILMLLIVTIKLLEKYQKPSYYVVLAVFFPIIMFAMISFDKNDVIG